MAASKVRRFLTITLSAIALLAVAAVGGGIYVAGTKAPVIADAERQIDELGQELVAAEQRHKAGLQALEDEVQQSRQLVALLQARRSVAASLDELDARNFGLSQKSSQRAAALLRESGVDDARVGESATALGQLRFEISGDFDSVRQTLRGIGSEIDALIELRAKPKRAQLTR